MLSEIYSTTRATRRNALNKLAELSAESTTANTADDNDRDMKRLCALGRFQRSLDGNGTLDGTKKQSRISSIPMSVKELEVLLALCKAAPLVQTTKDAEALLRQLGPYVREAHRQAFEPTPLYQQMPPCETLAFDLTTAVLALGINHPSLRPEAWSIIDDTIEELVNSAENTAWLRPLETGETKFDINDQTLRAIQLNVSLLGFFRGVAKYVRVWSPEQRMNLIPHLRRILSEKYMVSLEGALSAIRNSSTSSRPVKEWRRWSRHYAAQGQPLGAMLLQQAFMEVVEESCLALLPLSEPLRGTAFLDHLMQRKPSAYRASNQVSSEVIHSLTDVIANEMKYLDADADYLKLGSPWQQRLAREVKASALRSFLCCCILNGDNANAEVLHTDILKGWLDAVTADTSQMIDEDLAQNVLKCMTILASLSSPIASDLTRSMPRLLVQGKMSPPTATVASECMARILKYLPQDVVISTLYNLGNVLSTNSDNQTNSKSPLFDSTLSSRNGNNFGPQPVGSAISLVLSSSDDGDVAMTYGTIVQAIVAIAVARSETQLTALVISMLVQKIGRINVAVDARIIVEISALGLCGGPSELKSLLRLYVRIGADALMNNNGLLSTAVNEARSRMASWIKKDTPFFEIYLTHLLSLCVSSGDTAGDRTVDRAFASKTIAQLFRPMAILASSDSEATPQIEDEDELRALGRDAWFNIVVLGFTWQSAATKEHMKDLQTLALYSLPLIDEARVDMPESSIDLNAVLRRGASPQNLVQQKQSLITALPNCESDIKSLSYQECNFLNAALLVSTLRAQGGDSTAVLPYFLENKVKTTALGTCMLAVAEKSVATYLQKALSGRSQDFAAPQVALQLATLFEGCCHRIAKVQVAAFTMCDRIINDIPSALCQKASLFALLELLTLMWKACLDSETDEYTWKSHYSSLKGNVSVQLSDDVAYRKGTLSSFHQRGRVWVAKAIDVAPLDVKGLLQAYLEDYEDDGAYGHIALGRSLAVEMGALIPSTDQRLTSLERQRDVSINTASDFVAQYTTRQQYRHLDVKQGTDDEWALVDYGGQSRDALMDVEESVQDEAAELRNLSRRLRNHAVVPFAEVRDTLRNAAGILSRSASDRVALIQDLVAIPFLIFSKQSINLGISLWLGIVKENPSIESRILVEVAAGWEASVRRKKGFFDIHFQHLDPFYVKEEFAPSNWEAIKRREQITHNLIAPHLRLTHFLSSHFSATRLTSPSVERLYSRLMRITLLAMRKVVSQPLAREVHFHIVLLAQKILRYSVNLDAAAQWRLKDAIISAGLSWFRTSPRWSFGSNRLQLKAETKLLNDVSNMFRDLSGIGSRVGRSLPGLQHKQELLLHLISHEIGRLTVWIAPLEQSKGLLSGSHEDATQEAAITPLVKTAWDEDPSIAIQLCTRFVKSQSIHSQVRQLLLQQPEDAIGEADALNILLGPELASDVKTQLKYLLYWAPVNPMAAVTYFLPAYANHPFIVQYAVRALEAHSVDITFFYVPQIVQALRYDTLGYVERYIIETAAFSQLFAHQIIWNMKANAYKDEDSQEPDPVKPVLDRVMGALISSFLPVDKDFYEREFDFFGKVTGISGTLKPFIKRPKPEKKQKIEEELRKIQVEVGVYLPSNPDGVVIGIDRKSGKPLQSHAKAPFMATFRIRKEESEQEAEEEAQRTGQLAKRKTWEAWQSAIFKVGDDCRQDVLALQMIAAFRGIFNNVGLDVYVFPYRVTATAPGCGVIDVLPNSISRDMLGREAVNGLYEYFVSKYGYEDSIRFQEARGNFVKSMAAYSIISYLLQFKDRHNGNIMVDDAGHILHIDFGFCFDIAPGGVRFERAPFKLTPEMVAVMGGSVDSQPFKAFEKLCVKAFLASRQYVEQLAHIIMTMLDSGLPCFKPQTIQHFKERFVLDKSDREAAKFVRHLIHVSERSWSTAGYDYFQLLTNGIPY
ncbi:Phosphatidylinositol 4-kinase stt4 [Lecanosticta acicola]|uniref:1-phosphatidylinositol 4-kinase n=1 Tax=Lecanosticta acicola TaxID=111012 RepID=A0AAI8YYZ0_9PEZI|nr:Phosphatidylinositol 4-kinase stt4 [Lecanosticta acicola]